MRRNQLPPHPVVNTLCQSSLRKITFHPVIIKFPSGPRLFFFLKKIKTTWCQTVCEVPFFPPVCPTLNNIKKKFKNFHRHWQVNPTPRGVDSSLLFVPCFFLFLFSFFFFVLYFFLLLFCFYVGGSTSTGSITTLFSLLFKEDRFVENARQHGAHKLDHSQNLSL